MSTSCGVGANCLYNTGTFYCSCKNGYEPKAVGSCVDIDECSNGAAKCGSGAGCTNQGGSYKCDCPLGFWGNPLEKCTQGKSSVKKPVYWDSESLPVFRKLIHFSLPFKRFFYTIDIFDNFEPIMKSENYYSSFILNSYHFQI